MMYYTFLDSPLQPLLLVSDGQALTCVSMTDQQHEPAIDAGWLHDDHALPFEAAKRQLSAYFNGTLSSFDLPLQPAGTPFQQRVWEGLLTIPYGATISYGQLAARIDNPKAFHAVGQAVGRNPITIIIPCHRVIGADGSLTGYGGGLARKQALLETRSGESGMRSQISFS